MHAGGLEQQAEPDRGCSVNVLTAASLSTSPAVAQTKGS